MPAGDALWHTPLVDQWSAPLMHDAELFGHLGLSNVKQEVSYVGRDFREHAVLAELNEQRKRQHSSDVRGSNVLRLQAVVRGWIARRRYLTHKRQLSELMKELKLSRETEAVTAAQKMVRGCLARKDLKKRQEVEDRRRDELEAKKKKKGGKKKPQTDKPLEEMTRAERLVMQEQPFLDGWDSFLTGVESRDMRVVKRDGGLKKVEEAIKLWEKAVKGNPHDGVLRKMIDYAQRVREAERAREAQQREAEKAAAKAAPSGKGKGAGAAKQQRPSPPSSAASGKEAEKKRSSLEASYNKQVAAAGLQAPQA